jgi:hypothetical protein
MGGRDALRNPFYTVEAPSNNELLPLSKHARRQHRAISDVLGLRVFIGENPGRIERLVRAPFEVERPEDPESSTMRMPPFMRQSNAEPLTLSNWQYELLMQWVASANMQPTPAVALSAPGSAPRGSVAAAASARRARVLARLAKAPNP